MLITYHLVDAGHLGLEDGDGVTNGWLLGGNSGGSESSVSHVDQGLVAIVFRDKLGQHFPIKKLSFYLLIINSPAA